jgi:hypothetical protein
LRARELTVTELNYSNYILWNFSHMVATTLKLHLTTAAG